MLFLCPANAPEVDFGPIFLLDAVDSGITSFETNLSSLVAVRVFTPHPYHLKKVLSLGARLIVASLSVILAGCSTKSQVEQATEDGILLFGNSNEPKGLDPHQVSGVLESNIIRALFEGLCVEHQKEDGIATEGVAKSWTPNADFTESTFALRDDADGPMESP